MAELIVGIILGSVTIIIIVGIFTQERMIKKHMNLYFRKLSSLRDMATPVISPLNPGHSYGVI